MKKEWDSRDSLKIYNERYEGYLKNDFQIFGLSYWATL